MTFRTEHVGSLLRPRALLSARHQFAAGALSAEQLRAVEDAAVVEALRAQEATGIDVVTDGEYRRSEFRAGFASAVSHLEEAVFDRPWHSESGDVMVRSRLWRVTGNVERVHPIAADEARFLQAESARPFKVTLPAPGFMAERFFTADPGSPYAHPTELAGAFEKILRQEIEELIALGVPYVQIDNPGYSSFLDDTSREAMSAAGRDSDVAFRDMLGADVRLMSALPRTGATTFALHVCRGNNSSTWQNEGGYGPIAEQLFDELPVDRLLLEFDDDRSGGFDSLKFVPRDKIAVLGLISTKVATVESPDQLLRRLDEAARHIDAMQIAVSPQCGFATHADGGNHLASDEQYRKLSVAVETARRWFDGR